MAKQAPHPGVAQQNNEKHVIKKSVMSTDMTSVTEQLNQISRRLRVLEERYNNIQRKIQVTDQNMLSSRKRFNTEIKTTMSEVSEIKVDVKSIKDNLILVIKELKNCAKKEEVRVLDKYLSLWQPVKFVTHSQVERIVKDILDEKENSE
jgi:superfamily II helicase